jgi:hypothetical protein
MSQDSDASIRHPAEFHRTHWSLVLRAARSSVLGSAEALEELCMAYWYPL